MDDTHKMLTTIINGQSAMKGELLGEIGKVRKELKQEIADLKQRMDDGFKQVTKRIDMIGKQVAYLEDDAPTKEEFDGLEKRVGKLEVQVVGV